MKIESVPVDAAVMKTFGPDDACWKEPAAMGDVTGLFVRLDPPLNCPDEDVVRMRAQALDCGAVAVKVERTRRDAILSGEEFAEKAEARPHLSARRVVEEMLAESRSRQKEKLVALVEEMLKGAGL
jgi:hypothetical protein